MNTIMDGISVLGYRARCRIEYRANLQWHTQTARTLSRSLIASSFIYFSFAVSRMDGGCGAQKKKKREESDESLQVERSEKAKCKYFKILSIYLNIQTIGNVVVFYSVDFVLPLPLRL